MLRMTLTSAWSRKRRLVGTTLAIVLGVAFLSATLVLGDSARAGFENVFTEANAGTDAYVRSASSFTAGEEVERPPIDASTVEAVADLSAVAAVTPSVEGRAQVLDADGDTIGGNGPPTMAAGWIDDEALTGWSIAEGRAPRSAGEVVVNRATADDAGVELGDPLTVLVPDPVEVEVVGITTFGGRDGIGGTTYVGMTMVQAQELLLGSTDLVSGVIVAGMDGETGPDVLAEVRSVLPAGTEAISGDQLTREQQDEIESDFLGFFTTALTAFALTALVVASFSIFNTFSILVAQRTRESALLRALGASRRQVLVSALAESIVVGFVGSLAGAGAGVLLASGALSLMGSAGFGLPTDGVVVDAGSLVASVIAGALVTVIGGFVPAIRASRVAPLAALRETAVDDSGTSRTRAVVGALVTAAGAVVVMGAGESLGRAAIGAVVLLAGVILLGPVVARPVASALGLPLLARGTAGDLARRNAVRNPRRTASTATALLVGVGIVSLFTVFGASVRQSLEAEIDRTFGGDLALEPAGGGFSGSGISPALVDEVGGLSEVDVAVGLGFGGAIVDGRQTEIGFTDLRGIAALADYRFVEGDVGSADDRSVVLNEDFAGDHGYAAGDTVEVDFADGSTEALTVAAVYEDQSLGDSFMVSDELWRRHDPQAAYFLGLVDLADGVSTEEGRAVVDDAVAGPGAPEVMDRDEFTESQASQIDVLLTVIYGLLAIAIVIALMGIGNTISLSVHERTRELGLLRAVGQSRSQLRSMVRWESVIVSTFGAVGGLGLGLFLSWGLVRSLKAAEGFGEYAVPVGSLVVILAIGALAGLLAGLRPAWRASRLDVLDAVAAD